MTKCNPVTKVSKGRGRRRVSVEPIDFVKPPTETMLILAQLKNGEGHSWRTLAEEINDRDPDGGISHTLVRRVTLGLCKSPRIDYALGICEAPPPVEVTPCPECGKVHRQVKSCKPPRKAAKRRLSFWLDDDEFEFARAVADSHPDGRAAWVMKQARAGK